VALYLAMSCAGAAQAQGWRSIGPAGGTVISLSAAGDGTVYLGTADGHVFRAPGGTLEWQLAGRVGARHDAVVQQILPDVTTAGVLFAAVWFQDVTAGGGVFRSGDGGATWTPSGLRGEAVRAIEQSLSDPKTLVAGTRHGVFRSRDAGISWERISPADDPELQDIDSIAIDPRDPLIIYVGTYHLPWKTADGGRTWKSIAAGMIDDSDVMSLRIDVTRSGRVFASACSGIYRSENGGVLWSKLQGIPYSARRSQQIVQDARDPRTLLAATTAGLWITHNAGDSWSRTTPGDWVVNTVALLPPNPAGGPLRVLLGTAGQGVLASADGGVTFRTANDGFAHRVIAALAGAPDGSGRLLAEISDSRHTLFEKRDSDADWSPLPGDFPAGGARDLYRTSDSWFAALRAGGLARRSAAARAWHAVKFERNAEGSTNRDSPSALRRSRKSRIDAPEPPDVRAICASGARIYAATSDGLWSGAGNVLRRETDAVIPQGLRDESCSDGVWLASADHVLHRGPTGRPWRQWPLPPAVREFLWVRRLHIAEDDVVLAGTDQGVFKLSKAGDSKAGDSKAKDSWTRLEHGLPATASWPAAVSRLRLAVVAQSGLIYVSNDGGQTWDRAPADADFTGAILPDGTGGFIAATRADGILAWSAPQAR
jgi:photosystem II stability/assembly factor-like uncharacterized protein